jgi:hypothetical protein
MFFLYVYTWSCLYLCIYLSFGPIFHIWGKTFDLCQ